MLRVIIILCISVASLSFIGCQKSPTLPDRGENFNWCVGALQAWSIFQDSLTTEPSQYRTIQSLFTSINDPWTVYMTREENEQFESSLSTSSGGNGIYYDSVLRGLGVREVISGSPAEAAGMQRGDTIISVNGAKLDSLNMRERVSLLRGFVGDIKRYSILRDSSAISISVTLGTYMAPSVLCDSFDQSVAYIALFIFSDNTGVAGGSAAEIRNALAKTSWADYTILDLRGNPGGYVDQAEKITEEFVPSGTQIVKSHERYEQINGEMSTRDVVWTTQRGDGLALSRKCFILVDRNTASAAEMLVSCLQNQRSADIIVAGDTTYGKARSQKRIYPTPEGGACKITISLLSPIAGSEYDVVGIVPDTTIPTGVDPLIAVRSIIRSKQGSLPLTKLAVQNLETRVISINYCREEFMRRGVEPTSLVQ